MTPGMFRIIEQHKGRIYSFKKKSLMTIIITIILRREVSFRTENGSSLRELKS